MNKKIKRVILVEAQGRKPRRFVSADAFQRYCQSLDPKLNVKVSFTAK